MRSGLHGAPTKPVPGGALENTASRPTRRDSDYDCARVGEQVRRKTWVVTLTPRQAAHRQARAIQVDHLAFRLVPELNRPGFYEELLA